jgi:hypothetical protein
MARLERRIPGTSLHPLLRDRAVGVARVARTDAGPGPEVLAWIVAALRRLDRS